MVSLHLTRIRLQKLARRSNHYRIIVTTSKKSVQSIPIEILGIVEYTSFSYRKIRLNKERFYNWIKKGAQPSKSVLMLLKKTKLDIVT